MNPSPAPEKPLWNSLEFVKIGVGILTPLAIFYFTYQTNKLQLDQAEESSKRVRQETHERERFVQVTRLRTTLWSEISPLMNDVYCYFLYVGHWKKLTPDEIIEIKRKLDKTIYSNSPFFSPDFMAKYNAFISAAFKTNNGWGEDAKLKSPPIRDNDRGKEHMFERVGDGYAENTEHIHAAYFAWLTFAAKEMDVEVKAKDKPTTPNSEEIRARLLPRN